VNVSSRSVAAIDLAQLAGTAVGVSDWLTVEQARIDNFAEATGDHQWIHVDPDRAASGPFGGTIAHGCLTLSLCPTLLRQVIRITGVAAGINYGLNRVRFPAPVREGAAVRLRAELAAVETAVDHIQATWLLTIEIRGSERPACVAEAVYRYIVNSDTATGQLA
jgi:acyl dehydratase